MNLYYRIKNTISDFWYDFRRRCQRFKRGWAYSDAWDMNAWFVHTLKPMLIYLKNNGISYPIGFNDRSEWETVLDEMINCLNFMDEDYCIEFLGFGAVDYYKCMTREDWDRVYTIMAENKNKFFELFSEYFFDLWD